MADHRTKQSQIFCKHINLYQTLDEYRIPYVFIQGSYAQLAEKPHILLDDCLEDIWLQDI